MSAEVLALAQPGVTPTKDRGILALLARKARIAAELAATEAEIARRVRAWSYDRGYRVPLRPEQVRDEIIRTASGATPPAPSVPAVSSPPCGTAGASGKAVGR